MLGCTLNQLLPINGALKNSLRCYSYNFYNVNFGRVVGRCQYSSFTDKKRRTLLDFKEKYAQKVPLTMVTSYDYTSAVLADKAGIDSILVGDSFSMVMCGNDSTSRATIEEIVYHCKAVTRGATSSFIVADMPFGSYEICTEDAVRNAIRLIKEGNAHAVKLEGGRRIAPKVKAIVDIGIPVMGHIGLTPQSLNALGGYKVQGKTSEAAMDIVRDARALEEAGCYALVIESVPQKIAEIITNILSIPTIGIGAGNKTSGQILVWHDMFGLFQDFTPKFCKQYANLGKLISEGLHQYILDVQSREFPTKEQTYTLKQEEWEKFKEKINATTPATLLSNVQYFTEQPNSVDPII
jgi:3-methyl-2-oxobutanoate hydroxymethyltransferase